MIASYHNHTFRCQHAAGSEKEYVERAIAGGLMIFGFSDHAPYPFPPEYISHIRMRPEELEGYVDTVLKLKKEYENDIEIHLGLESEYYPAYFDDFMKLIEPYPIEYLLLGQHYKDNEMGSAWYAYPSDNVSELKYYTDQTIEGMNTKCFTYLAHPDLFNYTGNDQETYNSEALRICETAKALSMPLELNLLGLGTGRHYPNPGFFKIASGVGNKVILAGDAHAPDEVFPEKALNEAEGMIKTLGLDMIDKLEL